MRPGSVLRLGERVEVHGSVGVDGISCKGQKAKVVSDNGQYTSPDSGEEMVNLDMDDAGIACVPVRALAREGSRQFFGPLGAAWSRIFGK